MKKIKLLSILLVSLFSFHFSEGQAPVEKETIKVYGNCAMCKKTIESGAMAAGATAADWSTNTKQLVVSYDPSITSSVKIQEAIANSGYDTRDFLANESAYERLPDCCKYARKDATNSSKN